MTALDTKRTSALSIGLGFVAGYVDTVGFVALFGLFTAHVTGNFVLIGSVLAHSSGTVQLKLLVFPAFVGAIALARMIALWLERREHPVLRALLLLQTLFLIGFMLLGWMASPIRNENAPLIMWAGLFGAAGMGVQNATARLLLGTLAPTTAMTGNVTQLVIDVMDIVRGAGTDAIRERSIKFVWPIVAFALGAIIGAFGYVYFAFPALLMPIAMLVAMALQSAPAHGSVVT